MGTGIGGWGETFNKDRADTIIDLRDNLKLTFTEIAKRLGTTTTTVCVAYKRGKRLNREIRLSGPNNLGYMLGSKVAHALYRLGIDDPITVDKLANVDMIELSKQPWIGTKALLHVQKILVQYGIKWPKSGEILQAENLLPQNRKCPHCGKPL